MAYIQDIIITPERRTKGSSQAAFNTVLALASNDVTYSLAPGSGTTGLKWVATKSTIPYVNVKYVVSGNNTALSVARTGSGTDVSPYLITVNLATNGSGIATSTALDIKTAADLVSNVTSIVTISLTSTGLGVVSALAETPLSLDTELSKALVYRLFSDVKSVGELYGTSSTEYAMASKIQSHYRCVNSFAIYSKLVATSVTDALTTLATTEDNWYYLLIEGRTKALINEAGNYALANKKIFVGSSDDKTSMDSRNADREIYY